SLHVELGALRGAPAESEVTVQKVGSPWLDMHGAPHRPRLHGSVSRGCLCGICGSPGGSGRAFVGSPLHRLPKGCDGGLRLAHQHVRTVRQFVTVFDCLLCCCACLPRSPADFSGKERATVEMVTKSLRQVNAATRTQVCSVS